jgi:hypothetical protein
MSTAEERMQDAIEELEQENRLLRARNERLEAEAKVVSVQEPAVWTATRLWNRRELWNCPADIERDLLESYTTPPAAPVQKPKKGSYEAVFGHLDMTPDELGNYMIELQEKAAKQCKWPTCQSEKYQQSLVKQIEQDLVTGVIQQWVDLTDRQIESIFLDAGWSWGEKADMYVPAVREVLELFKEINE